MNIFAQLDAKTQHQLTQAGRQRTFDKYEATRGKPGGATTYYIGPQYANAGGAPAPRGSGGSAGGSSNYTNPYQDSHVDWASLLGGGVLPRPGEFIPPKFDPLFVPGQTPYENPFAGRSEFAKAVLEAKPESAWQLLMDAMTGGRGGLLTDWLGRQYGREYQRFLGLASNNLNFGMRWADYLNERANDLLREFQGLGPEQRAPFAPQAGRRAVYRF